MARAIRDLPAHANSLEVGINIVNAASLIERSFLPAFHGFLDTVRDGHPTPILIITPIICPSAENRPGSTLMGQDQPLLHPGPPRRNVDRRPVTHSHTRAPPRSR